MKIQQKVRAHAVDFSSLFRVVESSPDVIWMKTESIENDYDSYNAVDLSDGEMAWFEDTEKVNPVTINAVVEEQEQRYYVAPSV